MLLHNAKHYLGLPISKYKKDKYSAAVKLLEAYRIADYKCGIAY